MDTNWFEVCDKCREILLNRLQSTFKETVYCWGYSLEILAPRIHEMWNTEQEIHKLEKKLEELNNKLKELSNDE